MSYASFIYLYLVVEVYTCFSVLYRIRIFHISILYIITLDATLQYIEAESRYFNIQRDIWNQSVNGKVSGIRDL